MYQRKRIILDWIIVLFLYLCVLLIIPFSNKFLANLGEDTINIILNIIINILIAAVFIGLLVYLIIKKKKSNMLSYAWLIVFFITSVSFLMKVEITKERLHFVGYAILSLFLYRALRHNIGSKMLYVWSCLIIILFALLDEACQMSGWGGRSFEVKDVGIDWLSGLTGQLLIALVVRPKLEMVSIKIRKYTKNLRKVEAFRKKYSTRF